ncbi:MAG: caspase family protein, partial [Proteobacteria bacterium]|nr:caspase family protein [Pseudomonadota bacterium]
MGKMGWTMNVLRVSAIRLVIGAVFWLSAGVAMAEAAERRVALVVGIGAYQQTAALPNPVNDASDISAALKRTGFEVILATDTDKRQLDQAVHAFADKLAIADVALFYYAGHALQVGEANYLVPADARLASQRDLEFEAVKLDFVLRQMELDRDGKTSIVMLDACRDNPLSRSLARSMGTRSISVGQGLAPAATGVGTFIAYATQPGNVAQDGAGRNSPFTAALLANLDVKGRNLNATMIEVRKAVIKATDGKQVPWDHSALTGEFYFVPGQEAVAAASGGGDVEALKKRLKALEEAEQHRKETGAAGASQPSAETVAKLAEARARLAVAEDKTKELQFRVLDARRTEGQARDPAERARLQQHSMQLQMEWTRASLAAKQLREEVAALSAPPSDLDLKPARTAQGFDIYDASGLAGDKIKFSEAGSVDACL